ncbi:MAG: hypothetical protein SVU32_02805 [Candidatus Nanohaloarchaea archaeon]|nr:hypothetical protein [Candidatus Nanohaloarchaea archaeon]
MKKALLLIALFACAGLVVADPPVPPTPSESNSWQGNTSIKGCYADYNRQTNTLQYCNQPYIQYKSKELLFCDANNNGNHDSGEKIGSWDSPRVNCGWTPYGTKTVTRKFAVCGKVDKASNPDATPQTTQVSEDWYCPATKQLSLRHKPGNLDPGFGLAGEGYTDLNTLSFTDGQNMSFNLQAAVPACINRIPMLKLNVTLRAQDGDIASQKTGIYASHMNLYYGPNGDNTGQLKQVQLPEQQAFRRQYTPEATLRSYRMWAWRQRFADSVKTVVQEENLQLPRDVDVGQIAQQYRDQGKSVGNLWLSSDFLFGAEGGDPTGTVQVIARSVNSTCAVDVREIEDHDFKHLDDLRNFIKQNPGQAEDLFGREGQNYCSLGQNETLSKVWGVQDSGATRLNYTALTGRFSTKPLANVTGQLAASVNVSRLGLEDVSNSTGFLAFSEEQPSTARQAVRDHLDLLNVSLGDHVITAIGGFDNVSRFNVSMRLNTTRWRTTSDITAMDGGQVHDLLQGPILNESLKAYQGLEPLDRFHGKRVIGVLATTADSTYTVEARLNTSEEISSYYGFVKIQSIVKERAKRSWNWRALQDITMTQLAKCMYNWQACFTNNRSLESRSWDAQEIFDAGYGPWTGSFTFQWSKQAAQTSIRQLQSLLGQTSYDHEIDTTFDKYFDGARGTDHVTLTPINVYRSCSTGEGWVSEAGKFYHDKAFICPDGSNNAYTCGFRPGSNLPSYVERGSDGDVKQVDGDYYVCTVDSPGQWVKDTTPPTISCDDCIDPQAAAIGSDVEIDPTVTDSGAGVESVTVCGDASCSEIICGSAQNGCTYSSNEPVMTDLYVRASDKQGNTETSKIGSVTIARPIGAYCTSDDQCLSGRCSARQCLPQQIPPIIDFDLGDR